jgi:valyl-tRNA synthetase
MSFKSIQWKSKEELARGKLEEEIKGHKEKIQVLEKKIMGRGFIRSAGLQAMQQAKAELIKERNELRKAEKKLDDLGAGRK